MSLSQGVGPVDGQSLKRKAVYRKNSAREQSRQQNGDHYGDTHETHNHYYALAKEPEASLACTIASALLALRASESGLEHYADGVLCAREHTKVERELRKMKHALSTEIAVLQNIVESLFHGEDEPIDLLILLLDVQRDRWNEPALEASIRCRLGPSCAAFANALHTIKVKAEEIQSALQIGSNGKGPFDLENDSVTKAFAKSKYGFNIKPYWPLIRIIEHSNRRLVRLDGESFNDLEVVGRKIKINHVDTYRKHASTLFELLNAVLVRDCGARHIASLCMGPLETHASVRPVDKEFPLAMRVIFEHDREIDPPPRTVWLVEEAEVRPFEASRPSEDHGPNKRTKVHFSSPHIAGMDTPARRGQRFLIEDLCTSIPQWRERLMSGDYLGELVDMTCSTGHILHLPKVPITERDLASAVKLDYILRRRGVDRLRLLSRRRLALAIAQGAMQLYGTPWMCDNWSKDEVVIFQKTSAGGDSYYACMMARFDQSPRSSKLKPESPTAVNYRKLPPSLVPSHEIFALGIILIELELQTPFEELQTSEDSRYGAELAVYFAALRLLDVLDTMPRYHSVARRCIKAEFDHQRPSLLDRKVQELFFRGVILELEADIQYMEKT
ncbi:hypothetical protein AC578_71 [Pseudocercospora eumusae]|uniref:DUF7580 domain-containing protein n=1 Tax=Pseudocercospora eumusae TaxID=321146 RepID=A0A139HP53_9PEZI|nr:hypothetical protein AC578_71 [Pseudocercospora eumusae]